MDASGAAIPNAAISLTDLSTREAMHTTCERDSSFVFTDVPAGPQMLSIDKSGFESFTRKATAGSPGSITAALHVAEMSDNVIVRLTGLRETRALFASISVLGK